MSTNECKRNREIKFKFIKGLDVAGPFELGDIAISYYIEQGYKPLQYIGNKDKNGKEIYEGDTVISEYSYTDEKGTVMFNENNYAGMPAFHICDEKGNSLNYYYGMAADENCEIICQ